ncbi:MAG: hypothetical protein ACYS1A_17880 [Planctomycetota bacterium]|jgi:hypothetical protein
MSKENDFEGRCGKCSKALNIILTRMPENCLHLEPEKCPDHPEESMILWPQRDDIIENTN